MEYEVIGGFDSDDKEFCAGSTDWETAVDYAGQYSLEYDFVEVYEVTRKLKMIATKKGVKLYE